MLCELVWLPASGSYFCVFQHLYLKNCSDSQKRIGVKNLWNSEVLITAQSSHRLGASARVNSNVVRALSKNQQLWGWGQEGKETCGGRMGSRCINGFLYKQCIERRKNSVIRKACLDARRVESGLEQKGGRGRGLAGTIVEAKLYG